MGQRPAPGRRRHRPPARLRRAKLDPADVAQAALDGIEAGQLEILADDWSAMIKSTLAGDPSAFYTSAISA